MYVTRSFRQVDPLAQMACLMYVRTYYVRVGVLYKVYGLEYIYDKLMDLVDYL